MWGCRDVSFLQPVPSALSYLTTPEMGAYSLDYSDDRICLKDLQSSMVPSNGTARPVIFLCKASCSGCGAAWPGRAAGGTREEARSRRYKSPGLETAQQVGHVPPARAPPESLPANVRLVSNKCKQERVSGFSFSHRTGKDLYSKF